MIPGVRRNRALPELVAVSMIALAPMAARGGSVRCGWLDNPTPGNASLYDKDSEMIKTASGRLPCRAGTRRMATRLQARAMDKARTGQLRLWLRLPHGGNSMRRRRTS
jgi:hypothetical protein